MSIPKLIAFCLCFALEITFTFVFVLLFSAGNVLTQLVPVLSPSMLDISIAHGICCFGFFVLYNLALTIKFDHRIENVISRLICNHFCFA